MSVDKITPNCPGTFRVTTDVLESHHGYLTQPPGVFHCLISGPVSSHKGPQWKRSPLLRLTLHACSSPAALPTAACV